MYRAGRKKARSSQTYVSCNKGSGTGLYSPAVGSVEPRSDAPGAVQPDLRHPADAVAASVTATALTRLTGTTARVTTQDQLIIF